MKGEVKTKEVYRIYEKERKNERKRESERLE